MSTQQVNNPLNKIFYELIKSIELGSAKVEYYGDSGIGSYIITANGAKTPFICFVHPREKKFACVFGTLVCQDEKLSQEIFHLAEATFVENEIKLMESARLNPRKLHERDS